MGSTRLVALFLSAIGAFGVSCDQPNQLGNNCGSVNVSPTNVNNSSVLAQVVTHVSTQITMPNGTITTIVNTINYVGNSSDHIVVLPTGNTSNIHNIYTNIVVQSDNGPLIALVIVIICLAILKELMPTLKNRCIKKRQSAPAANIDPVDIASIEVKP